MAGTLFALSIEDQIAAVERELIHRRVVFPRRVAEGKLSQATAKREIDVMRAVLATLRQYRAGMARLPKESEE